jgi:hypothetical protein
VGRVLSIDLAYKKARDFGICLIDKRKGQPMKVEFIPPHELIADPPEADQCGRAIFEVCGKRRVRIVFLDGPQGWKDPRSPLPNSRHCEKLLATPGKTGTFGKSKPGNYEPFIEFAINVFARLVAHGGRLVSSVVVKAPRSGLLVAESFPSSAWRKLGIKPLPGKAKAKPRDTLDRLSKLQELFRFRAEREPTHDELQALVAGMAGVAILAGKPRGYCVQGCPPKRVGRLTVEGFIVNPCIEFLTM